MPNRNKDKGSRFERGIVHEALNLGLKAHRVPYSGSMDHYNGDVWVGTRLCECKKRHKPIAFIEKNLKPNIDALLIGFDGGEWYAVMRGSDWLKLL